ncbi:SDR family NAD(P)-dependent oxidoreductase [Hoeflea sp. TYP-13]|uniref:SDR family NAD(P)-dependent oxidoreductase n=1 Tax=Hoeflea sp. TYP-13 TaxID=3230023 RepID=UPI0034C63FBB
MSEQLTAVITGGNKGIGAEIARHMLDAGYFVISVARHAPDFSHERLSSVEADLLEENAVNAAASEIAANYNVTHLVQNAGMIWPNLVEDAKSSDITGLAQLHLGSALTLLQAFLPGMKERRFGRVIFNGSRAALGVKTRTAYSASKAGMIGMARTWALELAPHQITVNVVAPGPILTDQFWDLIPKDSEQQHELAARIPVGRLGTVEDIANAFMFFADPKASFVTGQTLYVCGGASVGTAIL